MKDTYTKGIAFKNFRRFKEFPMLEFGKITYMVGRNNSGKSTMVKALLLVMDYLKNQLSDTFSFDNQALEDANIVTFGRAKCNLLNEPVIEFNLKLNDYDILIQISGDDDRTKADVNFIHISDAIKGYTFNINYLTELINVKKKSVSIAQEIDENEELYRLNNEINELKVKQKKLTNKVSKEALQLIDQINKLQERRNKIVHRESPNDEVNVDYNLEYPLSYQRHSIKNKVESEDFLEVPKKPKEKEDDILVVDLHIDQLVDSIEGMTSYDILTKQLDIAKRQLELAFQKRLEKVIMIHGIGEGILRAELENLGRKYDNVIFTDADYNVYGQGAIEFNIDQNVDTYVRSEDNELKELLSIFLYHNSVAYKKVIEQRDELDDISNGNDMSSDIIELDNSQEDLKNWIDELVATINQETFYYLGANPSKQSALFQLRDNKNALAQAIHEFKQLGIEEGSIEDLFVKKWMREFEVGYNYKINFFAGEAYQFHVLDEANHANHLSDKGMGSLQAMLLILRVGSLIRINKKSNKIITLLLEEPELNLHPELQSKLTEFFHEVNIEFGFVFIIETHSEYMIRKAQLSAIEEEYVKNLDINPNPYRIFYFHKMEGPYEMKFTQQGRFERDFGPGFYDEAVKTSMAIIKEGRKNAGL